PLAADLAAIAREAGPVADRLAPALLGVRAVFGDDLPGQPQFRAAVISALEALYRQGSKATAAEYARLN
ncbi:hypothetical protein P409_20525, partial [Inquilinus limosus MP06]